MNAAQALAIKYLKRKPKAKVAHVVLDYVTDDIKRATAYRKAVYARKVSSFTRDELFPKSNDPKPEDNNPPKIQTTES